MDIEEEKTPIVPKHHEKTKKRKGSWLSVFRRMINNLFKKRKRTKNDRVVEKETYELLSFSNNSSSYTFRKVYVSEEYRVQASTAEIQRLNTLQDMDVVRIIQGHIEDKDMYLKANSHAIHGFLTPIELHNHFTENERLALCNTWYCRRYAVNIYDRNELTERVKLYMTLKRFLC